MGVLNSYFQKAFLCLMKMQDAYEPFRDCIYPNLVIIFEFDGLC